MAKARAPDTTPGVTVRSGIWLMTTWSVAVAAPSTYTGGLRSERARSALVMTKAPAPSVTRQQSRRCRGSTLVWRGQHVLDGERVAVAGPRIARGPFPGAHGDLGQLLGRGAVLVHVTRGGQRVGTHRCAQAVRQVPLHHRVGTGRAAPAATATAAAQAGPLAIAARRGGVDADDDVADAGCDGGGRVLDVHLVARAAGHGRLGEDRVDAEVLGEGRCGVRVADTVDVGQGQSGVLERLEHHRHFELAAGPLQLASGGDVVGHADDGGRAAQACARPGS